MSHPRTLRTVVPAVALGLVSAFAVAGPADAETTKTSGTARHLDLSWIVEGAGGSVEVGNLYYEDGAFGPFLFGSILTLECDEGDLPIEDPDDVLDEVGDDVGDDVVDATQDAIEAVIEGGGSTIDPGAVITSIADALVVEGPDGPQDELPECEVVDERSLDGTETATVTVDTGKKLATVAGTLAVSEFPAEDGVPGAALGSIAVTVKVRGGQWSEFQSSSSVRGSDYVFKESSKGKAYDGGPVTGTIGDVVLAEVDAYAGYSKSTYRTFEHVR